MQIYIGAIPMKQKYMFACWCFCFIYLSSFHSPKNVRFVELFLNKQQIASTFAIVEHEVIR